MTQGIRGKASGCRTHEKVVRKDKTKKQKICFELKSFWFCFCAFFIFVSCFLFFCVLYLGHGAIAQHEQQVCFQKRCFSVEIADESDEQQRGLMFRKTMPEDHGMLFVFQKDARYAFWMKNTKISLDMIWLDSSRHVVHIAADVPPCEQDPCAVYSPGKPARYVLELNAGAAEKWGIKVGDNLEFYLNEN